ncbi:tyrosine-type recombinase/integrase [Micromonospora taraxaci]|uniref:tyrosine-type recombinase/integrase n=1 Tax=Micromonospora taraxaci TaxID=1316803 RepID=UPI003404F5D2
MTDLAVRHELGDHLAQLTAAYLATLHTHTAKAYRYGITSWLDWCHTNGVNPFDAVPAQGQLWIKSLPAHYSDGTRANRLSAVRSWYEWLDEQDVPFRKNPGKWKTGRPKANPTKTPALSAGQLAALLDTADTYTPRDAAIVHTLATTGLRVNEVLTACVEDLGQDQGHHVLTVTLKGRRRHNALLPPGTYQRITTYLAGRADTVPLPAIAAGARPRRILFATDTGRRIDPEHLRDVLQRVAAKAGLPEPLARRFGPHMLRATFITLNLAAGKDLRIVQYAVGHKSPTTTEGYDRSHLSPDQHPAYALMGVLAEARARNTTGEATS